MDYFIIKPNFLTLAKYYGIFVPEDREENVEAYLKELTEKYNKEGFCLGIEAYLSKGVYKFDQNNIAELEVWFVELLKNYGLSDHYDNLLFVIVSMVQSHDSYYNYMQDEIFGYQHRIRELSTFIHAIKDNPMKQNTYELTLKSRDSKGIIVNNSQITDQKLLKWMCDFVIQAIDSGNGPAYLFGIYENVMLRKPNSKPTSISELRNGTLTDGVNKIEKSSRQKKVGLFCLTLLNYLNGETSLKTSKDTKYTDAQLRFLYNVLVMFDIENRQYDPTDKDNTPEKDLRTLLNDTAKAQKKILVDKST
jgi:hypothetical protein